MMLWHCVHCRIRLFARNLRLVPGVTEVNTIGGFEQQFHITPMPAKNARLWAEF